MHRIHPTSIKAYGLEQSANTLPATSYLGIFSRSIASYISWMDRAIHKPFCLQKIENVEKTLQNLAVESLFDKNAGPSEALVEGCSQINIQEELRKLEHLAKLQQLTYSVNPNLIESLKLSILAALKELSESEKTSLEKDIQSNQFAKKFLKFAEGNYSDLVIVSPLQKKKTEILLSSDCYPQFYRIYSLFDYKNQAILILDCIINTVYIPDVISILKSINNIPKNNLVLACQITATLIHKKMSSKDRILLIACIADALNKQSSSALLQHENLTESLYESISQQLEEAPLKTCFIREKYSLIEFFLKNKKLLPPISKSCNDRFSRQTSNFSLFGMLAAVKELPSLFSYKEEEILNQTLAIFENESLKGEISEEILVYISSFLKEIVNPEEKLSILKALQPFTPTSYKMASNLITSQMPARERCTLFGIIQEITSENTLKTPESILTQVYDYIYEKIHNPIKEPHSLLKLVSIAAFLQKNSELLKDLTHRLFVNSSEFFMLSSLLENKPLQNMHRDLFTVFEMLKENLNSTSIYLIKSIAEKDLEKLWALKAISFFIKKSPSWVVTKQAAANIVKFARLIGINTFLSENFFSSLSIKMLLNFYDSLTSKEDRSFFKVKICITLEMLHIAVFEDSSKEKSLDSILEKMILIATKNPYWISKGRPLGEGSFGKVKRAYHVIQNKYYAIKTPTAEGVDALEHEATLLDLINQHNPDGLFAIIRKIDWIAQPFRTGNSWGLVLELHKKDLREVLTCSPLVDISLSSIQIIGRQLIKALSFLQDLKIIHADLKPENILVKEGSCDQIVLSDFGESFVPPLSKTARIYKQSRWYRSPECALETGDYGYSIDIWSLGCVLIELFQKKVLFPADSSKQLMYQHQLYLGTYSKNLVQKKNHEIAMVSPFFQAEKTIQNRILDTFNEKNLSKKTSNGDEVRIKNFINLTEKIFELEPENRISAADALKHPFFEN